MLAVFLCDTFSISVHRCKWIITGNQSNACLYFDRVCQDHLGEKHFFIHSWKPCTNDRFFPYVSCNSLWLSKRVLPHLTQYLEAYCHSFKRSHLSGSPVFTPLTQKQLLLSKECMDNLETCKQFHAAISSPLVSFLSRLSVAISWWVICLGLYWLAFVFVTNFWITKINFSEYGL